MGMFFDQDIAHIARVMAPSLEGDLGGPILPAEYWRGRLHRLLDATHLTRGQLCALDSLLLQLDDFEARSRPAPAGSTYQSCSKSRLHRTPRQNIA
ncbi:hypothetical protein A6V36_36860 [Paraburkholderia ginsengiterrae]|uniref:Uncharacterized protein n=1 Tax=Paraburkholderia ginsengiterrae TaxID=1462993 RepID=A0A1A9MVX9_9BURK|nr:hypothetical protein [Paraburkholderia ginsengiterrae]OAJ51720.1 hypothetical protein A6V37_37335 [Paraburkholderia ginsengiterrae]OAJ53648.1 hypothetical protein A6V36_36860 [Paraburkholderia ginsengiterrae]